jgi:hypothetical protein
MLQLQLDPSASKVRFLYEMLTNGSTKAEHNQPRPMAASGMIKVNFGLTAPG